MTEFRLVPPAKHLCQQCAWEHPPELPHNLTLFYRYWYYYEHGQWPTWEHAIAHCDEPTRSEWREALIDIGALDAKK